MLMNLGLLFAFFFVKLLLAIYVANGHRNNKELAVCLK